MALEALVPENLRLSEEIIQQIVKETHLDRGLSQSEIRRLASMLNMTFSEYERRKEIRSEPTSGQLRTQISALHKALKGLKFALPSPEQISLHNYLIHLGEAYAATYGPHPNLAPHSVGGLLDTGEEVSAIDHYRSDERLDEMISSVSQVLEWMNTTPASIEKLTNWWNRNPHWREDQSELMERLEKPRHLRRDTHRRRSTEWLIGDRLPQAYEMTFKVDFGVSRPPGPGVRFVLAVLRHAGVSNDRNRPFSSETVIKYRQNHLRRRRRWSTRVASSLDDQPKN